MNDYSKTLRKMKKAGKLVRLAQRKNGPKSYKRGQGALLRTLIENDGATQVELVSVLGRTRREQRYAPRCPRTGEYVALAGIRSVQNHLTPGASYAELGYLACELTDDGAPASVGSAHIADVSDARANDVAHAKSPGSGKHAGEFCRITGGLRNVDDRPAASLAHGFGVALCSAYDCEYAETLRQREAFCTQRVKAIGEEHAAPSANNAALNLTLERLAA